MLETKLIEQLFSNLSLKVIGVDLTNLGLLRFDLIQVTNLWALFSMS